MDMNYRQIQPIPSLIPYIRYFGILEGDNNFNKIEKFKVITDGCPGLIFQENSECFLDKGGKKYPQLFLHGINTRHSEKISTGHYNNIIVCFQPYALKLIFGIDAYELTDQYAELSSVFSNNLNERLLNEPDTLKRIEIFSRFFLNQLLINNKKKNMEMAAIIGNIQLQNNLTLHEIQSGLNISERRLERIFKGNIGVSPKLFLRINRFQKAISGIRTEVKPFLTKIAHKHSYSDQSHFIREFKEFAGCTPKQFLTHAYEQVDNFPEWQD